MLAIKNVLVATDFSECSDTAVTYARALAGKFGAQLHIFHVVQFVSGADVSGIGGYAAAVPTLYAELEADARERLGELVSDADRELLHVKTAISVGDVPASAIVAYAKTEAIDLIVIGTHGRRGLSHVLLGSVAESVVRMAPCPVLTVRHPQHEFVVPNTGAIGTSAQPPS
jgi:nucleotide-binding universal stress UspA family protein